MTLYKKCLELATKIHEGEFSRNGEPYIEHCKRVADWFDLELEQCEAVLHDTLETGKITFDELKENVGDFTANGVLILTKRQNESYEAYIKRIPSEYVKIKVADITDNLCRDPSDRQKEKYRGAMKTLLSKI